MADALQRSPHRYRQAFRAGTVTLQQVKGHALRRARTDTRQTAQGLNQGLQR